MKKPVFGFDRLQSFIDFFTGANTVRLGVEGKRIFTQVMAPNNNEEEVAEYLTDANGKLSFVPSTGNVFDGEIDLSKQLTIYSDYDLEADTEISIKSNPAPMIGGYAEIALIGDGLHSPSFAAGLTATPGSDSYDSTLDALNKIGFYYDGTRYFYTITVIV